MGSMVAHQVKHDNENFADLISIKFNFMCIELLTMDIGHKAAL